MAKLLQESRPTSVTVIGWAWIIIGGAMLLAASLGLVVTASNPAPIPAEDSSSPVPFAGMWAYIVPLAFVQLGVGVIGLVAGIRLLALEAWARTVLEVLSGLLILVLVSMALGWIRYFLSLGGDEAGESFGIMFPIVGVFMVGFYGAPLGLMIYHLRSDKLREAVSSSAAADEP